MSQPSDAGRRAPRLEHIRPFWRPEWASGHVGLDAEHAALIDGLSDLVTRLGAGARAPELRSRIDALVGECGDHFASEEALLAAVGYPGREQHAAAHAALLGKLEALRSAHPGDWEVMASRLFEMIVLHLTLEDRRFFAWVGP